MSARRAERTLIWKLRYRAEKLRRRPASLARELNLDTVTSQLQQRTSELAELRARIDGIETQLAGA